MSSNQQSTSSYSYSSSSYSSSSSSSGFDGQHQVSGYRAMESSYTDPSGQRTTTRATQELGGPVVSEERSYDKEGRELIGGGDSATNGTRRIEDVSDEEQAKNDRAYEEAIEDEYAKREGGA